MDECWVRRCVQETKSRSKQGKRVNSPVLKTNKTKCQRSAVIVKNHAHLSVFWNFAGALLKDCAHKGQTITRRYNCELFTKFRDAVRAKRGRKLAKGVCLLQRTGSISTGDRGTCCLSIGCEIFLHFLHSPDVAHSDLFLLPRVKKPTARERFSGGRGSDCSNGALPGNSQNDELCSYGRQHLIRRWRMSVPLKGGRLTPRTL